MRRFVPRSAKLALKLALRRRRDRKSGVWARFAVPVSAPEISVGAAFAHVIELKQPIRNASTHKSKMGKIYNIKRAARAIEALTIMPGQVFSFWHSVGNPNRRNGYREGVTIVNGEIVEDFGGGLCQLASIIYHLSLIAGVPAIERSCHSVDLYEDDERYVPLGADAAVYYGYKDLRLRNDFDFSLRLRFEVEGEDTVIARLESLGPIVAHTLTFDLTHSDAQSKSVVSKRVVGVGVEEVVAESVYRHL